ncbi:metallophosphoesterase [Clostridium estertheticum]|uniref:metallophosphoesterase n=1 Tax=Clostridium estertheticum TaxID=238834 RepID=UPI0013E9138A|nr:metallophosphoesterase [Clostridium estertheticum]MBZ9688471.1 metallophosphoesterase [Clostridium estertheticum]
MLIIGDVHGELELLKMLLDNVHDEDVFIVGDVINRGLKSLETLQFVMQKGFKVTAGNHELLMLNYLKTKALGEKARWVNDGGYDTYKAYQLLTDKEQKDILNYLTLLPLYYYLDEIDLLISHSGINPQKLDNLQTMLKEHNAYDFTSIRRSFIYSAAVNDFSTVFIVGHTPTFTIKEGYYKFLRKGNKIFIDTGAVFKGTLGALQITGNLLTAHYVNKKLRYWNENFGFLREV